MRVLVTGSSGGIGLAIVKKFLDNGHTVIGFDRNASCIEHTSYTHYCFDIRNLDQYPQLDPIEILINAAGTQNEDDISINLNALIDITEHYGVQNQIHSILHIGSASGHTGSEFPKYAASKGGIVSYTKNVALRIASYGATCNSLDPGGVLTPLNECVINDTNAWKAIMDETPLKRWATVEEIADWAYFLTIVNRFATGQSIVVDGGESILRRFVWIEE